MMKPSHPSGHQLVVIRVRGISPVVWRYVCIMRVLKYHAGSGKTDSDSLYRGVCPGVFDGEMMVEGVTARLATSSAKR